MTNAHSGSMLDGSSRRERPSPSSARTLDRGLNFVPGRACYALRLFSSRFGRKGRFGAGLPGLDRGIGKRGRSDNLYTYAALDCCARAFHCFIWSETISCRGLSCIDNADRLLIERQNSSASA